MSQLDRLPPDQRAALSLLLRQGKSYTDVADMLRIHPDVVRERAHVALEALGPHDTAGLTAERRSEIGDYLLGQQSASQRASARRFLEGSAAGRAWARVVSGELRPLSAEPLPEVPAEGAEVEEAFEALQERTVARKQVQRSSRLGGALLLAGIGVLIAVVIIVVVNNGGGSNPKDSGVVSSSTPSTATSGATGATGATGAHVFAQINLVPTSRASHALAVANIISQGQQRAFAMQAQGLAPTHGFAYVAWLYNSQTDALPLGFAPAVKADGRLQAIGALPGNASRYKVLVITRETTARPTQPGPIVLAGQLGLTG
jgi:hypothetical protein